MDTYWEKRNIYIDEWIFKDHSYLSFCEEEIYDAIQHGQHRSSVRVSSETYKEQEIILTKSKRWNGNEIELISKATPGYNIKDSITVFHAFSPFTRKFLLEWRNASCL